MFHRTSPRYRPAFGLLFLGLLATGCANQRAWPSGFLTHNADLQATGHRDDVAYIRPGVDWKAYRYACIEPAVVRPTRPGAVDATLHEQTELAAYLQNATTEAVCGRFAIVDKPAARTVLIRTAIT